jgi:hypothetical protein
VPPWLPAQLRKERPAAPLRGYKLAYPMVSADGAEGAFSGVTIGRGIVYRTVATAVCAQGAQHSSPSRWCDCGFYCVHSEAEARALACDPDYRYAMLLAVAASGRFLRYERGLRYARQRVTAVWAGRCGCGRPATMFTETGAGVSGWRQLAGSCAGCAGGRPGLSLDGFARLLDGPPVLPDGAAMPGQPAGPPAGPALDEVDREALVPVLTAEVALLQARLDEVQRQLARLTQPN